MEIKSITRHSKTLSVSVYSLCFSVFMALGSAPMAAQEEFLRPLPLQELAVGELFTLGIRPRQKAVRSSPNAKIELYAEGLSAGASFRRAGQEIWEFAWVPREADRGVHTLRVLVTERGDNPEVLEAEEITFVVGETPTALSGPVELDDDTIIIEASATDQAVVNEPIEIEESSGDQAGSVAWDATPVSEWTDTESQIETSIETERANPAWALAPVSSHVVSPYRWVRFPVDLISDADDIDEYVLLHIDRLPRGASFSQVAGGGLQFQWRPGGGDIGEHKFRFTAVDKYDASRRENVDMRIIVQ